VTAAALALALAACGGKQPPAQQPSNREAPPPAVRDTRPELERRRDAACGKLGPKLARCAVQDSDAQLAAGKITRQQHDEATKPDVVRALAEDFRKKCRAGYMSSRQVRVLEVCFREESECAPLESCLGNLRPDAAK
jgi:predicted small lipoprotein YifL